MKVTHKTADFSKWDDVPDESVFNEWQYVRKQKHKVDITQSSVNRAAPHINRLYQSGISATQALEVAAENGWRGIKYAWVMREIYRDMEGMSDPVLRQDQHTRDISTQDLLTDRGWASD